MPLGRTSPVPLRTQRTTPAGRRRLRSAPQGCPRRPARVREPSATPGVCTRMGNELYVAEQHAIPPADRKLEKLGVRKVGRDFQSVQTCCDLTQRRELARHASGERRERNAAHGEFATSPCRGAESYGAPAAGRTGSVKRNVVRSSTLLSTDMRPPWASTSAWLVCSPRPMPGTPWRAAFPTRSKR